LTGVDLCAAGSAARLALGGPLLHQPPELLVALDEAALRARCADAVPAEGRAGWFDVGGWRVRPAPEGLSEALAARVIPVDAIGVRPGGGLVDPLDGVAAWRAERLMPERRDALEAHPALLVRLVALAGELSLRLDDDVVAWLAEVSGMALRAERGELRDALTQLLLSARVYGVLQLLESTRLLAFTLPEVAALVDFHKSSRFHHKDVWHHTRLVVRQALPRPQLRWAALLHDIGKVHTRGYGAGRKVHFLRHEELGAVMFEGIAARLQFPVGLAERVRALILHHLRANLYDVGWTDAAVRRFAAEMGPWLGDLIHLSRADVTSRRPGRRREAMFHLHQLRTRIERLRAEEAARRPTVPRGLGNAIIEALGIAPGPRVGELRRLCEEAVRDGRLPPEPDVETCLAFLRARPAA
jgi:poly(A) polymerase